MYWWEVPSFKKSKQGMPKLVKNDDGTYRTVTSHMPEFDSVEDELVTVFENGNILVDYTFEEIRERASIHEETLELV